MSKEVINKIRNTRLARKAQVNSGLFDQIKSLRKEIVTNSFSEDFDIENHRKMIQRLKMLKDDYKNIADLSLKCG